MSKKEKSSAHHAPHIEKSQDTDATVDSSATEARKTSDENSVKAKSTKGAESEGLSQSITALEKRVAELESVLKDNPVVAGLMKVQERISELESKASEISEKSEKAWLDLRQTLTKAWDDLQTKRGKSTAKSDKSSDEATPAH